MSDESVPTGQPPAETPVATTEEAATSEKIVLTSAQLADRMNRHTRSQLKKELGVDDPALIKAQLAKLATYETEREKARLEQLSAEQRAQEEWSKLEADLAAAKRRAEDLEVEARVARAAVDSGIRNLAYAQFRLGQEVAAGRQVDEREFLATLAKDPVERAALGIPMPAGPGVQPSLPTTSPGNGTPPPAPTAGTVAPKKTAFDMTAAEWAAYREQNGL
jgi:multidrug efflux pump subunit AcrA (membrane-fusion protein)